MKLLQKNATMLLLKSSSASGAGDAGGAGGAESAATATSSAADPRENIPWTMSDAFHQTGYAHRKGQFRLKPLELWA